SKIQTAAFSRAKIPEDQRRDFYLYVDEFQNFTTDSFATILSEARKYRLSLNITNQYIAQLSEKIRDAVIGNAGSMIVYRVGAADAEFMAKEFPGVTIDDMVNLEAFHTYIKVLIDLTPSKPFSLRGVLSPVQKNNELGEAIRQLSIMKYTKTRQELEAEFIAQYKATSTPPAGINEPLRQL
ncbi:TraM recognition domain-containing protein, partial [Candidatus Berkelbacteria bacterium]|nr:TraM recognition domain-containing protein [Candidatus Berkelbacteria bacterium]